MAPFKGFKHSKKTKILMSIIAKENWQEYFSTLTTEVKINA